MFVLIVITDWEQKTGLPPRFLKGSSISNQEQGGMRDLVKDLKKCGCSTYTPQFDGVNTKQAKLARPRRGLAGELWDAAPDSVPNQ